MISIDDLSAREKEVLHWIVQGKTNWEISLILDVSLYTVKNHVSKILQKLHVNNRTHATKKAIESGYLDKIAS